MKRQIAVVSALALLAGLGGAGLATQGAFAQSAPPASSAPAQIGKPNQPHWSASRHIEGRIAFLKAELAITPQQQAQWDKLAQVMRDNAKDMDASLTQMRAQMGAGQENAVQHLEARGRFAAMRAQASDRFLAAFRPLYDSLSDQQKKTADELMTPHRHHHHDFP